jgi:hypothetical protein
MIVAQLMIAAIMAIDMMYTNACSGSSPTTTTAIDPQPRRSHRSDLGV